MTHNSFGKLSWKAEEEVCWTLRWVKKERRIYLYSLDYFSFWILCQASSKHTKVLDIAVHLLLYSLLRLSQNAKYILVLQGNILVNHDRKQKVKPTQIFRRRCDEFFDMLKSKKPISNVKRNITDRGRSGGCTEDLKAFSDIRRRILNVPKQIKSISREMHRGLKANMSLNMRLRLFSEVSISDGQVNLKLFPTLRILWR